MKKAIFISGHLNGLSNNIIPLLDSNTDIFVHTWEEQGHNRWITKLNRYSKACNSINIVTEKPKIDRKRISYLYSTYSSFSLCKQLNTYDICIKFKPNLDTDNIKYITNTQTSFSKAKLQSRPLLEGFTKEDCVYGTVHYKSIDERFFTIYPKGINKVFNKDKKTFYEEITKTDELLSSLLGTDYEGSLLWTKLFEQNQVPIIQDINLTLPNNKQWQ